MRFVDTINRSLPQNPPLPLPDVWGTLQFNVDSRRHLTLGKRPWVEELGICNIIILARSGHGDAPGTTVGDAVMRAWDCWNNGTPNVMFQNVSAPDALDVEAQGDWYGFLVACAYRVQERLP